MSPPPPYAYQEGWKRRFAFTSPLDCRILTLLHPPKDFCLVRLARPSTRYHISSALTHTHPVQLLTVTPPS
ncbi:hypothetical protein M405DRAFT_132149 [Rhizopogon salebrosus TDB-379]|nr:hypothetical protein M405DRAFT_132149 [Rhizopogon salebrosus TDB-379]